MTLSDWALLAEEIDTRLDDGGCDRGVAKGLRSRVWKLGEERDTALARAEKAEGQVERVRELLATAYNTGKPRSKDTLMDRILRALGEPDGR